MRGQAVRAALLLALVACSAPHVRSQAVSTRTEEGTLVVYSYRQSDPEALGNFQYFLDRVLSPRDPARYIIVVDHNSPQQRGHMSLAGLPRLPTNAQYLSIRDCYELGHVGKVLLGLKSKHVSTEQYDYFVWLDSSVKRTVFPTHDAQGDHAVPWHTQLTSRISSTTKLIGASISCEAATPQQVISVPLKHPHSSCQSSWLPLLLSRLAIPQTVKPPSITQPSCCWSLYRVSTECWMQLVISCAFLYGVHRPKSNATCCAFYTSALM